MILPIWVSNMSPTQLHRNYKIFFVIYKYQLFFQIPVNSNGTIPYQKFLEIFVKVSSPANAGRTVSQHHAPGEAGDVPPPKTKSRKYVVADASKEISMSALL